MRTIRGIVVPYGVAGKTDRGLVTFAAGSLSWPDADRVKLIREHDQHREPIGYGVELTATPDGVLGRFAVPDTHAGDVAAAEVRLKLRDSFSIGVELDSATLQKLRRAQGAAVAGAGRIREVSLVVVPAWEGATAHYDEAA